MKKTPLHSQHLELGARMIDFGGWHMPVQYSGIQTEHLAVRQNVGIFDVSHMGEVTVEGPDAEVYLNKVITNDVTRLNDGQALYTVMCMENGGIVDDLIVYKRNKNNFFICVNASNTAKDFDWFLAQKSSESVTIQNRSDEYCQIAIQGPKAQQTLQQICSFPLEELGYFYFCEEKVLGEKSLVARTGYTGEDGFEIYMSIEHGPRVWKALLEAGQENGLRPCGLGARDTLRMEASLALYGNDIDSSTNPIEAGLGWVVKFNKNNFIAKAVLEKWKQNGTARKFVGIRLRDKVVPRQHYEIYSADQLEKIGVVTSGTLSLTLNFPIAMGYIDTAYDGSKGVAVKIRDKFYSGELVKMPFYRRKKEQ